MALTDTTASKKFIAGAPDIILKGDYRREKPEMKMASMDENEREFMRLVEEFMERGFNQQEAIDAAREEFDKKAMAYGGRAQYGLGSLVKSVGKAVKGAVKGVAKGVKRFAKSDLGKAALLGAGIYGLGGGFGAGGFKLGNLPGAGLFSGMSPKLKGTLASFAIGSLGSAVLSAAEAGGLDTSDPNAEVDLESLTGYLTRGYKNLNPNATDEEVFQFVQENTAEYRAMGGRIGYDNGGYTFEQFMKDKGKVDQFMGEQEMRKLYEKMMREKKVREQKTMVAEGGRIGYAMGTDDKVMMAAGIEGLPVRQNKAGVKELDLRETGGFIQPVGIKEKADDIPAMLSNNEFVFTADAVRAAGGGDIDKGAQLMYDTMKKLESKVV